MICTIHIQAEPTQSNPGGCFTIATRLPTLLWAKLKMDAWYISQDDIDDEDAFDLTPGWRYTRNALVTLVREGHTLKMYGEEVSSIDRLNYLLSNDHQRLLEDRQSKEAEEADRLAKEAEVKRAFKGDEYNQWKASHLGGLVGVYTGPSGVEWKKVAYFDSETPGAWYTTGDTWCSTLIGNQVVYQCEYGNAVVWYAPQPLADQWCEDNFARRVATYGLPKAARWVLEHHEQYAECIGGDVATRLVQIHGAEYFAEEARKWEWLVLPFNGGYEMVRPVISKYNLPAVALQSVEYRKLPSNDVLRLLIDPSFVGDNLNGNASNLYISNDGRLFGCHSVWSVWELTPDQIEILNQSGWKSS